MPSHSRLIIHCNDVDVSPETFFRTDVVSQRILSVQEAFEQEGWVPLFSNHSCEPGTAIETSDSPFSMVAPGTRILLTAKLDRREMLEFCRRTGWTLPACVPSLTSHFYKCVAE